MSEKSLKDQLAEVVHALGFKSPPTDSDLVRSKNNHTKKQNKTYFKYREAKLKFINLKSADDRFKIKIAKDWADIGRTGKIKDIKYYCSDISKFCDFVSELSSKEYITFENDFYCRVGFKLRSGLNCHLSNYFCKQLLDSAVRASFTNKGSELFFETLNQLVDIIDSDTFEARREKLGHKLKKELKNKEREIVRKSLTNISSIVHSAINEASKIKVWISHPELTEDDIQLAISWTDSFGDVLNEIKQGKFDINSILEKYSKNFELGRVLSARAGEKAAKEFYENYGWKVEDVSIKQLIKDNTEEDWKLFDLLIKGYSSVDAKNSRRSKNSPDRYVEHCVPKFKQRYFVNEDVKVVGVLSQYLWVSALLGYRDVNMDTEILFLGEVTSSKLEILKNQFENETLLIDFRKENSSSEHFLPPWVFDYPGFVYNNRDEVLNKLQISDFPEIEKWNKAQLQPIPLFIAKNVDLKEYWKEHNMEEWEWNFFYELFEKFKEFKLSLPFLYLILLKHFLTMAGSESETKSLFNPNAYKKFVFYDKQQPTKNAPLFIYDPLETINGLIGALSILWNAEHKLIRSFKKFRLLNYNILQGQTLMDKGWKTLIAYCGGWTKTGKCGKNPLILGNQKLCSKCGKIICDVCGFCSARCDLRILRKNRNSD